MQQRGGHTTPHQAKAQKAHVSTPKHKDRPTKQLPGSATPAANGKQPSGGHIEHGT